MSQLIKCKIVSLATISLSYNTSTIRFMLDFTIFCHHWQALPL